MYQLLHLIKNHKLDYSLVESLIKTLYYGTGLSAVVLDSDNNKVLSQGPAANYDEIFEDLFEKYESASKEVFPSGNNGVFVYESLYNMSFFSMVITEDNVYYGSILLGPYLIDEPNEHFINEIMNTHEFSMSKRDYLKNMYGLIPVLNTSRSYYIQQLLIGMIANPAIAILHPQSQVENLSEESIAAITEEFELEKSNHNYALELLFLTKVQNGDLEKVVDLYNEHIKAKYYNQTGPNYLRYAKNKAVTFASLMARAIIKGGVESEKALSLEDYYINKIEQSHNLDDLVVVVEGMVVNFTNSVLKLSSINHVSVIKNASKYVHMHLSEVIRLNDVANYVNLSPNYFSSLFKREMNLSFADYVNQTRIKESQYLLETTNYSILDIAISVGYNNQNYFTTIFKKFTGITPKQFRMRSAK